MVGCKNRFEFVALEPPKKNRMEYIVRLPRGQLRRNAIIRTFGKWSRISFYLNDFSVYSLIGAFSLCEHFFF